MEISIKKKKKLTVVSLGGELDHHVAQTVRDKVDGFLKEKGVSSVVFDMTRLSFMDSSGLGLIMGRYKLISPLGERIFVMADDKNINRIIKMSGIDKYVTLVKSLDEAENVLGKGERV